MTWYLILLWYLTPGFVLMMGDNIIRWARRFDQEAPHISFQVYAAIFWPIHMWVLWRTERKRYDDLKERQREMEEKLGPAVDDLKRSILGALRDAEMVNDLKNRPPTAKA